jgi:hypothetical protein
MQKHKTIDHIMFIEGKDRVIAPHHKDENIDGCEAIKAVSGSVRNFVCEAGLTITC